MTASLPIPSLERNGRGEAMAIDCEPDAAGTTRSEQAPRCSFCSDHRPGRVLIAGRDAYICAACIRLCHAIVARRTCEPRTGA